MSDKRAYRDALEEQMREHELRVSLQRERERQQASQAAGLGDLLTRSRAVPPHQANQAIASPVSQGRPMEGANMELRPHRPASAGKAGADALYDSGAMLRRPSGSLITSGASVIMRSGPSVNLAPQSYSGALHGVGERDRSAVGGAVRVLRPAEKPKDKASYAEELRRQMAEQAEQRRRERAVALNPEHVPPTRLAARSRAGSISSVPGAEYVARQQAVAEHPPAQSPPRAVPSYSQEVVASPTNNAAMQPVALGVLQHTSPSAQPSTIQAQDVFNQQGFLPHQLPSYAALAAATAAAAAAAVTQAQPPAQATNAPPQMMYSPRMMTIGQWAAPYPFMPVPPQYAYMGGPSPVGAPYVQPSGVPSWGAPLQPSFAQPMLQASQMGASEHGADRFLDHEPEPQSQRGGQRQARGEAQAVLEEQMDPAARRRAEQAAYAAELEAQMLEAADRKRRGKAAQRDDDARAEREIAAHAAMLAARDRGEPYIAPTPNDNRDSRGSAPATGRAEPGGDGDGATDQQQRQRGGSDSHLYLDPEAVRRAKQAAHAAALEAQIAEAKQREREEAARRAAEDAAEEARIAKERAEAAERFAREEAEAKAKAEAETTAALAAQIEAKRRAKEQEEAREREADAKLEARVAREQRELAEKYEKERRGETTAASVEGPGTAPEHPQEQTQTQVQPSVLQKLLVPPEPPVSQPQQQHYQQTTSPPLAGSTTFVPEQMMTRLQQSASTIPLSAGESRPPTRDLIMAQAAELQALRAGMAVMAAQAADAGFLKSLEAVGMAPPKPLIQPQAATRAQLDPDAERRRATKGVALTAGAVRQPPPGMSARGSNDAAAQRTAFDPISNSASATVIDLGQSLRGVSTLVQDFNATKQLSLTTATDFSAGNESSSFVAAVSPVQARDNGHYDPTGFYDSSSDAALRRGYNQKQLRALAESDASRPRRADSSASIAGSSRFITAAPVGPQSTEAPGGRGPLLASTRVHLGAALERLAAVAEGDSPSRDESSALISPSDNRSTESLRSTIMHHAGARIDAEQQQRGHAGSSAEALRAFSSASLGDTILKSIDHLLAARDGPELYSASQTAPSPKRIDETSFAPADFQQLRRQEVVSRRPPLAHSTVVHSSVGVPSQFINAATDDRPSTRGTDYAGLLADNQQRLLELQGLDGTAELDETLSAIAPGSAMWKLDNAGLGTARPSSATVRNTRPVGTAPQPRVAQVYDASIQQSAAIKHSMQSSDPHRSRRGEETSDPDPSTSSDSDSRSSASSGSGSGGHRHRNHRRQCHHSRSRRSRSKHRSRSKSKPKSYKGTSHGGTKYQPRERSGDGDDGNPASAVPVETLQSNAPNRQRQAPIVATTQAAAQLEAALQIAARNRDTLIAESRWM